MPYIQTVENMFFYTETGTLTHRHLRIIPPPGPPPLLDYPAVFNENVSVFIEAQYASLLRIKTILSEAKPMLQTEYHFNDTCTDLLEMLNILWETSAITPGGNNITKSAFFTAVFRLLGLTLPNSFFQQVAQTTRRHNPTKYLDELRKKYGNYLSETLGK